MPFPRYLSGQKYRGLVNWTGEPASELALKHYIQNNLVKGTAERIAKNENLYF